MRSASAGTMSASSGTVAILITAGITSSASADDEEVVAVVPDVADRRPPREEAVSPTSPSPEIGLEPERGDCAMAYAIPRLR